MPRVEGDEGAGAPSAGPGTRVLRTRGHRTRARLLDAGAEVFAAKGFHSARVDDIVRVAESSHGTFYLYFASKEDLFQQLVAEVSTEITLLIGRLPQVTKTERGRTSLRNWFNEFADLYERYGPVIRTWTEAELSGGPAGRQGDDALGALVGGLLLQVRIPKRAGLDPTVATVALVTMCERLNYYAATDQVMATRDELLDTLLEITEAAIFG